MFDLRVTNRAQAIHLIRRKWPTHVVTAMVQPLPDYGGAQWLHLAMDDVTRPQADSQMPTLDHVRAVLAFTADLVTGDRLLIHCLNGANRSPALAITVLRQHGASIAAASGEIAAQRPGMRPNRLLMQYAELILGTELRAHHASR